MLDSTVTPCVNSQDVRFGWKNDPLGPQPSLHRLLRAIAIVKTAIAGPSTPHWMWAPALVPLVALLVPFFAPSLFLPFFGKETAGEHLNHAILLLAGVLFIRRYYRPGDRVKGDLLLGLGTLLVFLEEIDYGLLYAQMLDGVQGLHTSDVFHNTDVGLAVFFIGPVLFVTIPWVLKSEHWIRQEWFPVSRTTATAAALSVIYLIVAQFCPHEIAEYALREGADEVHDLGFAVAVAVTAVRPEHEPEIPVGSPG